MKPTRSKFNVLKQIYELIPGHLVYKLAKNHGVDTKSRSFRTIGVVARYKSSTKSHIISMLFRNIAYSNNPAPLDT